MNDKSASESCENSLQEKASEDSEGIAENASKQPKRKSRVSLAVKATEEGKALLKEMGFDDTDTPGRRRTRAATRGEVYTPPPPKRERRTPGSGGSSRRGRRSKNEEENAEESEAVNEEHKDVQGKNEEVITDKEEKPEDVEMTLSKDEEPEEVMTDKKSNDTPDVTVSTPTEESKEAPVSSADSAVPKEAPAAAVDENSITVEEAVKKESFPAPVKSSPDNVQSSVDTKGSVTVNSSETKMQSAGECADSDSTPKSSQVSGPASVPAPALASPAKSGSETVSQSVDSHTNSRPEGVALE